jgi:predicted dehydrogenase
MALSGPGKGQLFDTTAADNNLLLLDWGDSLFGMTDIGYCAAAIKSPRAEYYGDQGALIVNGGSGPDCIEVYEQHEDLSYAGWVPAGSSNLGANFDISVTITHLIDCLVDGSEPLTSGRHALHVTEIMDLAEKSSGSGVFHNTTTST